MAAPQRGVKRLKNGGRLMYGEVRSTQRLTPSMVRVVLGGGDLDGFVPTPYSDQYINAQFFPGGVPYTAPFDPADFEALNSDHLPRGRRYTVRNWERQPAGAYHRLRRPRRPRLRRSLGATSPAGRLPPVQWTGRCIRS